MAVSRIVLPASLPRGFQVSVTSITSRTAGFGATVTVLPSESRATTSSWPVVSSLELSGVPLSQTHAVLGDGSSHPVSIQRRLLAVVVPELDATRSMSERSPSRKIRTFS